MFNPDTIKGSKLKSGWERRNVDAHWVCGLDFSEGQITHHPSSVQRRTGRQPSQSARSAQTSQTKSPQSTKESISISCEPNISFIFQKLKMLK